MDGALMNGWEQASVSVQRRTAIMKQGPRTPRRLACAAVFVVGTCGAVAGYPAATATRDDTAPVRAQDAPLAVTRRTAVYTVPDVELVRDDERRVTLAPELDDGRVVVMNFVYTSCTAVCPMSSHLFEKVQELLGPGREHVHLVSISIDPEQDTPEALRAYAAKFHAGPGWQHYTGTRNASLAVQRAFDAYRGDKMNHVPLTLLRSRPGQAWVRLDGFATSKDVMAEIEHAVAER